MNRNYLNEFVDLPLYDDCLSESDYKNYSVFLKKNILTEMTAEGFADILKRVVFNKRVLDSDKTTIKIIKDLKKVAQQTKYERRFGQIIKNGRTHPEKSDGEFCDKSTFKDEFSKQVFPEKDDLATSTTPSAMLDEYLDVFDNNGWLISEADKEGYEEIIDQGL